MQDKQCPSGLKPKSCIVNHASCIDFHCFPGVSPGWARKGFFPSIDASLKLSGSKTRVTLPPSLTADPPAVSHSASQVNVVLIGPFASIMMSILAYWMLKCTVSYFEKTSVRDLLKAARSGKPADTSDRKASRSFCSYDLS